MLVIKHTVETTASPKAIWDIWQDVANWKSWDHGIEFSTIDGPFKEGTTGTLKPKGGPQVRTDTGRHAGRRAGAAGVVA